MFVEMVMTDSGKMAGEGVTNITASYGEHLGEKVEKTPLQSWKILENSRAKRLKVIFHIG
jgi:hypothetical protein